MNITKAKWTSPEQTSILATIDGQEMIIPNNMGNRYRRAIAEWEAEGNEIEVYNTVAINKYETENDALVAMMRMIDVMTDNIVGHVPNDEKVAWTAKEESAKKYLAGNPNSDDSFIIETEADIVGDDYTDLCNKILFKAAIFRRVVAVISGLRRKTMRDLKEAQPDEYEAILNNVMAEAIAAADEIGVQV